MPDMFGPPQEHDIPVRPRYVPNVRRSHYRVSHLSQTSRETYTALLNDTDKFYHRLEIYIKNPDGYLCVLATSFAFPLNQLANDAGVMMSVALEISAVHWQGKRLYAKRICPPHLVELFQN